LRGGVLRQGRPRRVGVFSTFALGWKQTGCVVASCWLATLFLGRSYQERARHRDLPGDGPFWIPGYRPPLFGARCTAIISGKWQTDFKRNLFGRP